MTEDQKLLQDAAGEIERLRSQNNHMSTRLQMFDDIKNFFNQGRGYGEGIMSPDVLCQIKRRLREVEEGEQLIPDRPHISGDHPSSISGKSASART